MELKTRIKLLGLRPKDAPKGVTPNQFGKWLRAILGGGRVSVVGVSIVTLVCELMECRSSGSAGIFSEPEPKKVKGNYGGKEVEFVPAKVSMFSPVNPPVDKVPKKVKADKPAIALKATGFPSWGLNKTYKVVGGLLKLNFGDRAYKAWGVEKVDKNGVFVIDGVGYAVSEFEEV